MVYTNAIWKVLSSLPQSQRTIMLSNNLVHFWHSFKADVLLASVNLKTNIICIYNIHTHIFKVSKPKFMSTFPAVVYIIKKKDYDQLHQFQSPLINCTMTLREIFCCYYVFQEIVFVLSFQVPKCRSLRSMNRTLIL